MTVNQAAERIHYSPDTVRRWCREGRLSAEQHGKTYWITEQALAAFVPPKPGRRPSKGE